MADIEKVIKEAEDELEFLLPDDKNRLHMGIMMKLGWIYDALELLKEQRKQIEAFKQVDDALTDRIIDMQDEQPQIIRCKDCHFYKGNGWCNRSGIHLEVNDEWFCADGEKRSD